VNALTIRRNEQRAHEQRGKICCSIKKVRTDKFRTIGRGSPISHRRMSFMNSTGKTRGESAPY